MDRCALFVDAGYALADGAVAVHGTRRLDSVSWDHAGLLKLLAGLARDRTALPVLRCYWYEAAEGRTGEHDSLAEMPGLKLRLVNCGPGRREGIESQVRRDLVTLAKSGAISDAFIASADEHLAELVSEVQDLGLRVVVLHISAGNGWTIPQPLRQECDDIVEISGVHLRPFVDLIRGAEPSLPPEQSHRAGHLAADSDVLVAETPANGALSRAGLPAHALPAAAGDHQSVQAGQGRRGMQPYDGPAGQSAAAAYQAAPVAREPTGPQGHATGPHHAAHTSVQQPQQYGPGLIEVGRGAPGGRQPGTVPGESGRYNPSHGGTSGQFAVPPPAGQPGPALGGQAAQGPAPAGEVTAAAAGVNGEGVNPADGAPARAAGFGAASGVNGAGGATDGDGGWRAGRTQNAPAWTGNGDGGGAPGVATDGGRHADRTAQPPYTTGPQPVLGAPEASAATNGSRPASHQAPAVPSSYQYPPLPAVTGGAGTARGGDSGQFPVLPPRQPGPAHDLPVVNGHGQYGQGNLDQQGAGTASGGVSGGWANGGVTNGGVTNGGVTNGGVTNGGVTNGAAANGTPANGRALHGSVANGGVSNGGASGNGGMVSGRAPNASVTNATVANGWAGNGSVSNGGADNGGVTNGGVANGGVSNDWAASGGVPNGSVTGGGVPNGGVTGDWAADGYAAGNRGPVPAGPQAHVPGQSSATGPVPVPGLQPPRYPAESPYPGGQAVPAREQMAAARGAAAPVPAPYPPPRNQQQYQAQQQAPHQYRGQPQAAPPAALPVVRQAQPVAVSLPDAVKAAHNEGFTFGESVSRDAPGLWLEAVFARKPRMPSDLEARLLQGSGLPIDSLLQDEVRHSLRRGFWDALESARR